MYISSDQMPSSSRLWIYQASRDLTPDEVFLCGEQLQAFCETWAAHGQSLQCSWEIHRNRFVLLMANEAAAGASGCSIDASTRIIRKLGEQINVDFFDRRPAFLIGDHIEMIALDKLSESFASGKVSGESLVFHLLASTLGEWKTSTVQPASDTWLRRYIRPVASNAIRQ